MDCQKLQDNIIEWAEIAFGKDRPIETILTHLLSKVKELKKHPADRMEYADCIILLLDAAGMAGFDCSSLHSAARSKLKINKSRRWGKARQAGSNQAPTRVRSLHIWTQ